MNESISEWPRCKWCGYKLLAGVAWFYCDCDKALSSRAQSARSMRERMEREFSWVDPRTLEEIMEEANEEA